MCNKRSTFRTSISTIYKEIRYAYSHDFRGTYSKSNFTCLQETIIADLKWLIFRFYVFQKLNIHIYHPQLQNLKSKIYYYYDITRKIVHNFTTSKQEPVSEHILNYLATYLFSVSEPKKKALPKSYYFYVQQVVG